MEQLQVGSNVNTLNNLEKKEKKNIADRMLSLLGLILCVILIPVLIINCTLIFQSFTNQEKVPSIGGYLPLIVLTDSMYPNIQSGDLIICHTLDAQSVKEGDAIAFYDPAGNGSSIVTHRVISITEQDGELAFETKGDYNNTADAALVPAGNLVGIYKTRIPGAGNVAMFMQTTAGLITCVVVPVVLLIGYDMMRRHVYERKAEEDTQALLRELEELKARAGKE
jgi:signal peptidase